MECLDVVMLYLRDLMCADVIIYQDRSERVEFNGARSLGDFNSRLMTGEIMCTSLLAEWMVQVREDTVLKQVVTDRFYQLSRLFAYDEQQGWTHTFLRIEKEGKSCKKERLPAEVKFQIDRYLSLQHASFERQEKLFTSGQMTLNPDYCLKLGPTELIELSLALLTSQRLQCRNGNVSQIGAVRFMAQLFGMEFPVNYDSLLFQLRGREHATKFIDELRRNLIACIRKKR